MGKTKGLFLLSASFIFLSFVNRVADANISGEETEMARNSDAIRIEVLAKSPSEQETPLQVVCLFEYTEGDVFTSPPALPKEKNGLVHVDEALHGLITGLRKSNKFEGKFLETLLIVPPPGTIAAKKLLLIGLGNKAEFKTEKMRLVGVVGMREALRLSVPSYSHASDLKDSGIASNAGEVAANVVKGAISAFNTQNYLRNQNASEPIILTKIVMLAGPDYFDETTNAIKALFSNYESLK